MTVYMSSRAAAIAIAVVVALGVALTGLLLFADEPGRRSRPPESGASNGGTVFSVAAPSPSASGHVPNAPAVKRQSVVTPVATASPESSPRQREGSVRGRLARLALSIDTDDWVKGQAPGFPIRVRIPASLWAVSTVHNNLVDVAAPTYEVSITSDDPNLARPRIEGPEPLTPKIGRAHV